MLRLFALLLLVANGLFFAWSNGYLSSWGFASASKNESFRLNEQIEPDRIVIKQKEAPLPPTAANNLPVQRRRLPLLQPQQLLRLYQRYRRYQRLLQRQLKPHPLRQQLA